MNETLTNDADIHATTRAVWLVAASGGWWKSSEIGKAVGMAKVDYSRLAMMVQRKNLVRREITEATRVKGSRGRPECVEYAVTGECVIPLGVTVVEAMKAMGAWA